MPQSSHEVKSTPDGKPAKAQSPIKVDHHAVIKREKEVIDERRRQIYLEGANSKPKLTGISLSGGGIRSACFNLGLLEGLDRLVYPTPPANPPETNGAVTAANPLETSSAATASKLKPGRNHLELFDYVSSVSGGSYAAGHLATAMLPWYEVEKTDEREKRDEDPGSQWFGQISLTSKTIPNWFWVVGVWFLGVAFQLLKTGSLLVGSLAGIAWVFRTLDSPYSMRFYRVLGLKDDLSRGFAPFWVALALFLVLSWVNKHKVKEQTNIWLRCAGVIGVLYVVATFGELVLQSEYKESLDQWGHRLFWFHLGLLLALALLVVGAGVVIVAERFRVGSVPEPQCRHKLRKVLLTPVVVALFCLAGLVTTGEIYLHLTDQETAASQEVASRLALTQKWISWVSVVTLGVASLAFLFPKNLSQSARYVEASVARKRNSDISWFERWVQSPVFSVIVFLASHGFMLILVLVLYGWMARENISGYYEWREDLPSAAWHPNDFKKADQAWERIALDARQREQSDWRRLARKLMDVREKPADQELPFSLDQERREAAEIRLLEAMPWPVRVFPPLMYIGPGRMLRRENYQVKTAVGRLYELKTRQEWNQDMLARLIAKDVLGDRELWKTLPVLESNPPGNTADYRARWKQYVKRAKVLATLKSPDPGIEAEVRANNRTALQLYLPDLTRDRVTDKVVFAAVVWREDQWTRLWIVLIAGLLWCGCCAVDVNTFSLQRFYRGHVIDSWVKIATDDRRWRWLHETKGLYRGHEYQKYQARRPGVASPPLRRAPLLLINATLGRNRSRGDEPDLGESIFTFSPIASGYGPKKTHWFDRDDDKSSFACRSNLDIGNIVSTSGAFLAPGNQANPALSVIFHLLNLQTGYWVRDPQKFPKRDFKESLKFHLFQSLGVDREEDSRFLLSDGAHAENLGLYVLLKRRCSLIVASDCSQEEWEKPADQRFDALAQVLRQARVDGIEIGPFLNARAYRHWIATGKIVTDQESRRDCRKARATGLNLVRPADPKKTDSDPKKTDVDPKKAASAQTTPAPETKSESQSPAGRDAAEEGADFAREHYVFAQIIYPDDSRGLLVYLRPTLTGDEGDALMHGAARTDFPDDDPVDQFYTPSKMKTYRLLGRHIAEELMSELLMEEAWERIVRGQEATSEPSCGGSNKGTESSYIDPSKSRQQPSPQSPDGSNEQCLPDTSSTSPTKSANRSPGEKEECHTDCDFSRSPCELNRPRAFRASERRANS